MASFRLLVLDFVRGYIGRLGVSPSQGEIAAALGCGHTRVRDAVRSLVADQLLLRGPGQRGLALPDQRAEALRLLRGLGWNVDEDVRHASVPLPRRADFTLQRPAPLDYVPARVSVEASGGGDERNDQGGARTRKGRGSAAA